MAAFLRGVFIEAPVLPVNAKFHLFAVVRVHTKTLSDLRCMPSSKEEKAFDAFLILKKDLFFFDKEDSNLW